MRKGKIAAGAKAGRVELFREMSDFRRSGEIEGLSIDPVNDDLHIPVDTRSAFPVISVQSPVSIQYRWQS